MQTIAPMQPPPSPRIEDQVSQELHDFLVQKVRAFKGKHAVIGVRAAPAGRATPTTMRVTIQTSRPMEQFFLIEERTFDVDLRVRRVFAGT
jgi:hypothetical protein